MLTFWQEQGRVTSWKLRKLINLMMTVKVAPQASPTANAIHQSSTVENSDGTIGMKTIRTRSYFQYILSINGAQPFLGTYFT